MANNLRRFSWSLALGAVILSAGVVLLLDQQGLVSADRVFQYFWPVIFIAFGLSFLECKDRRILGFILLTIGTLLILENLGIAHINFGLIWPLIVIGIGVLLIWRTIKPTGAGSNSFPWWNTLHFGGADSDSEFNHVAVFSGFKRRTNSKAFRGGKILAVFGGFQIDLRQADIEGDFAVIEAISFMGGGEIKVPYTWRVSMDGIGLMGGYVDETDPVPATNSAPQKRLIVKGAAIMGGVVVKN
jgi:hypothetical protein